MRGLRRVPPRPSRAGDIVPGQQQKGPAPAELPRTGAGDETLALALALAGTLALLGGQLLIAMGRRRALPSRGSAIRH